MPKGIYKRTEEHKKHLYAKGKPTMYKCKLCGKEFQATPSAKRQFCSNSHARKYRFQDRTQHNRWQGKRVIIKCPICNKYVEKKSYLLKKHKNLFCSCECQAIWKCKHQKKKSTNIELAMKKALKKANIEFIEQNVFPKICIADFYLPKYNLAIFCDGEYWHNFPLGKKRDKLQIEKLNKKGINAIRLWGKQCLEENSLQYISRFL